jgi:hypothetical protein
MDWRLRKQIIYGLIIFLIFFLISFFIFLKIRGPVVATCFDDKQNQGEEGIDCGGPCPPCELKTAEPLKIYPTKYLIYSNSFDILGILENPNKNLAVENVEYYFEVYDLYNNLKATTTLKKITLEPETRKYLLEINYPKPEYLLGEIKLKIINPKPQNWKKREKIEIPVSHYNERVISDNKNWKLAVNLFNNSYKNQDVDVFGLVYNQNNDLVAVGQAKVFLKPQEVKEIFISLPYLLSEPAAFEIHIQQ